MMQVRINDISKDEFLRRVLEGAEKYAQHQHIVKKATKALLGIGGKGQWIEGERIFERTRFSDYRNRANHDLWVWNRENANVTEKQGKGRNARYMVKEESYGVLKKVMRQISWRGQPLVKYPNETVPNKSLHSTARDNYELGLVLILKDISC